MKKEVKMKKMYMRRKENRFLLFASKSRHPKAIFEMKDGKIYRLSLSGNRVRCHTKDKNINYAFDTLKQYFETGA